MGKTSLWSDVLGALLFPFTPPKSDGSAGTIDNMTFGSSTPRAGTFTRLTATSTVSFTGASQTLKDLTVSSAATLNGVTSATGLTTITQLLRGATSLTTAANASPQGVLKVASTAAKTFTLGANVIGGDVDIICTAGGTNTKKVVAGAGVSIFGFLSSVAGSSKAKTTLSFTGLGQAVRLRVLSSIALQVMSKSGAVTSS